MNKPKPELINDCCVSCGKIGGTTPHLSGPRDVAGNRSCPDYMGCMKRQAANKVALIASLDAKRTEARKAFCAARRRGEPAHQEAATLRFTSNALDKAEGLF